MLIRNFNWIQLLDWTFDFSSSLLRDHLNNSCANEITVISAMFLSLTGHLIFMDAYNVSVFNHSRLCFLLSNMMLTKLRKVLPSPTVPEVLQNQIKVLLSFSQLDACGSVLPKS